MHTLALVFGLALGAQSSECTNPPPRTSDSYWSFIDACGCDALEAPPSGSDDYARFLSACSDWRQRNPRTSVVVIEPTTTPPADAASRTEPSECRNPPSRVSSVYWSFIDACGCANLEAPSRASADHDRYMKACSAWRERNPRTTVIVSPRATATPNYSAPAATPTPRRQ